MAGSLDALLNIPYIGEIFSVTAALVWAFAVILFRIVGRSVHPLALNLFKNVFALVLVVLTAAVFGVALTPDLGARPYLLMIASGILGITVSDTLFLASLNKLGASLTAIVDCFYSPFIIGFSMMFLGETMSALQIFGVALIISAVLTIGQKKHERAVPHRELLLGAGLGTAAMLTMAAGIVMIKPLLASVPLIWAVFMRLAGAAASLAIVFAVLPGRKELLRPLARRANLRVMAPAAFLGTYLSLMSWMAGMKYTFASVAAALSQLSTIFIFILAAIFLKEKATPWRILAIGLAFLGAYLATVG
ncbi:MAG: DMT family transporter [Candidatus Aminicenantes bacterium]|nr:DMT family transporter [Candidatus Aminicenantes bacterium]